MLSRATARASNHLFFKNKNSQFLGLSNNLSYAASNPVSNFVSITWNNNNTSRMSKMKSFTTRATAQPLKNADELIDSVETFIFDCDGVIWKGDKLIDGVPETLDMLRSKGKRLVFVTNNSTKSRKQYGKKFETLGLNVSEEEIFASSFAAAAYLKSINFPKDKKVYVIGEDGILKELEVAGFQYLGGPEDGEKKIELKPGFLMEHDESVGAVVVGFDRYVNYFKIQYGTLCIRENPGCLFIATNRDAVTHLTDAQEWAGGGSMVGAIQGSTQREPLVVGKPSTFMMDYLANEFGILKSQICMVGNRNQKQQRKLNMSVSLVNVSSCAQPLWKSKKLIKPSALTKKLNPSSTRVRLGNNHGVKAFFSNPIEEPIVRKALQEPVAFMGGMFAGLLRLDLNDDPLKEWVSRTVEASGITEEEVDAEGLNPEEETPQQIEIE